MAKAKKEKTAAEEKVKTNQIGLEKSETAPINEKLNCSVVKLSCVLSKCARLSLEC
ncbi:hypothetical protein ACFPVS_08890 [Neisseria weixii]|uniref:hypothetical protein n=1 Tax=Neisseria weixii TaxID=1853276 RepID=UPI0018DFB69E|nr:hypothetical protein [Neisseria weixii]